MTAISTTELQAPLLIQVPGIATQAFYLKLGLSARLKDSERTSLGAPVVVCDSEGHCSLHEVIGITRPRGMRTVKVGPQVDWPSGGRELRQIDDYR